MIQIDSSAGLLYDPRLADPARKLYLAGAQLQIELNKAGALTVTIPPQNPGFGQLNQMTSEVWAIQDGAELFRGRVREIHEGLEGMQEIVTEGLKAYMRDEQLRPYKKTNYGSTVQGWLTMAVNTYNAARAGTGAIPFSVGTVDAQALEIEATDYKDIMSAIDSDLIGAVGGYVSVIRSGGYNVISWTKESGPVDDQVISYGVNLTGYKRDGNASDLYTAVIPLGKSEGENGKLTIKTVNSGSDMLVDTAKADVFGLIVKVFDHTEIDTPEALKTAGEADLAGAGAEQISVEASAVDLADAGVNVGRLRLGHYNQVQPKHNGQTMLLPISKITADLLDPKSGKYTFAQKWESLSQQQAKTMATAAAAAQRAAAAATPESVAVQITQSETKYADYVSQTGSASGWRWRKWNGKDLEAWGVFSVSMGAASAYAADLEAAEGIVSLPISTANTGSILQATVCDNSDGAVASIRQTATDQLTVRVIAPSVSAAYQIAITLRGRYT